VRSRSASAGSTASSLKTGTTILSAGLLIAQLFL
jgi:hypothetical protein